MTEMRKRTIGAITLLSAFLVSPVASWASEASVSADTYISRANGALNFGNLPDMSVGPGNSALIRFDLSALQSLGLGSADIQKATLTIYVSKILVSGSVDLAEVQTPWAESTVTYNAAPAAYAPPAIDSDIAATQAGFLTFDVTGIVRNWLVDGHPNNGVEISVNAANPNTSFLADSKENTATSHAAFLDATLGGAGAAGTLAGDVTGAPGATVVGMVGGSTAANIHAAELLANAATAAPTPNAIPKAGADGTLAPGWLPPAGNGAMSVIGSQTLASSPQPVRATSRTWSFPFQGMYQAGVAGFAANLPASGAPTPTSAGGTDPAAVLEWPVGQNAYYAWWDFILPRGYVSKTPIGYTVASRSNDSMHAAILRPSWACVSTGTVDAPNWTAADPVSIAVAGNNGRALTTGSITPSCATTDAAYVKFVVDTTGLTSPFDLISVSFNVQGSM